MKKFFSLVFLVVFFSCSSYKNLNLENSLTTVITSEEFIKSCRLCEINNDTIKIINNTQKTFNLNNSHINCKKTLIIEKSNLVIDVNETIKIKNQKIILYKFENFRNKYVFTFLDNESNMNLTISVDYKKKVKIVHRGFF